MSQLKTKPFTCQSLNHVIQEKKYHLIDDKHYAILTIKLKTKQSEYYNQQDEIIMLTLLSKKQNNYTN